MAEEKSGRSWVGPVIGLGLLAGAGYLGYKWYQNNKCDTLDATKCKDGTQYKCTAFPSKDYKLFNYWKETETECTETDDDDTTGTKGDACSVLGAGYCNNGKYFVCKSDGYAHDSGEVCSTEQCLALACGSSNYACGGIVDGDETTDYYYDYRCNPITGRCNFLKVRHDSTVCNVRINTITATVNDSAAYINGAVNPYTVVMDGTEQRWVGIAHAKLVDPPEVVLKLVVKDQFGRPMEGIGVMFEITSGFIGGIVDSELDRIFCKSYATSTDENGTVEKKWLWTWNNNQTTVVNIKATIYDYANSKTYTVPFQLVVYCERVAWEDMFNNGSWTVVAYDNEDRRCKP